MIDRLRTVVAGAEKLPVEEEKLAEPAEEAWVEIGRQSPSGL